MQSIILAAGEGKRLADFNPDGRPKCLLEFAGKSLLSRQLNNLYKLGIHQVTLVVGYEADMVIEHVATLESRPEVAYVYNPAYDKGSVLSLLAAQQVLRSDDPVLVLDADVLYHPDVIKILVESVHANCILVDLGPEPGEGIVDTEDFIKVAVKDGRVLEIRSQLKDDLQYDLLARSVGYYKFAGDIAKEIADTCESYSSDGLLDAPHEEVLRDVVLRHPGQFAIEGISGLPWLTIKYPEDI